jgi:hypothetical protein
VLGLLRLGRLAEVLQVLGRVGSAGDGPRSLLGVLLAELAVPPVLRELVGSLGDATLVPFAYETSFGVGHGDTEIGAGLTRLGPVGCRISARDSENAYGTTEDISKRPKIF